jgi:hypothetical protein
MKFYLIILAAAVLLSCQPDVNVTITNPSDFNRSEIIEIPVDKLPSLPVGKAYRVTDSQGERQPSQLTYDNKLLLYVTLEAGESITYNVDISKPTTFPAKTHGRFFPERKDDFAWENDRVAFRIYGQALVAVDGPSNGLDLWYKRTDDLIIDKWYKDDLAGIRSYHEDHGEGLDDYKVGRTLGGGMMAPFVNDTLILNENFVSQEIFENGPLRTTFRLTYKDVTANGQIFAESRTFSLDAGSQLTKVTQSYDVKDILTVAAGIVKRPESDNVHTDYSESGIATVIYEEPASENVGKVFVGMIFPRGLERVTSHMYTIIHPKTQKAETHAHVLGITSYCSEQPIVYYTGYGWEKFGYPSIEDFREYMKRFSKSIEEPLIIDILE